MRQGFVLVHGGEHGAWCWERLIPYLDWPALAVDLPGRGDTPGDRIQLGIADFVASAAAQVADAGLGAVVLVAHSMAGLTAPGLAAALGGRVKHLVFVAAVVPRQGHSLVDEFPFPLGPFLGARFRRQIRRGRDQFLLPAWLARRKFCSDMTAEQTAFVMSQRCFDAPRMLLEQADRASMPSAVARTWVKLMDDRAVPPRLQDRMIANLGGAAVVPLAGGHDAMVSRPRALAEILNAVATASFGAPPTRSLS